MEFLAHRGMWKSLDEKNSLDSLKKAISAGYGIETDLRDRDGRLVVSHDISTPDSYEFENFLKYYKSKSSSLPLALNIKADGLQKILVPLIEQYDISNYFLFDMSIPEFVVNVAKGLRSFTRNSDIESECVLYEKASGVWLDSFYDDKWLTMKTILHHLHNGKTVCIVSPELHGWDKEPMWRMLKSNIDILKDDTYLCTDHPEEARRYFYG